MPSVDGRFVMRSQFLIDESEKVQESVTYWLDSRNGNVLHQRPTAIQEPKFYTQLKSKAILDDYYAYADKHGKEEAVAVYGQREILIGSSSASKRKLDVDATRDTRSDYVTEDYSHFSVVECEQFKRPKEWVEKLTRKELIESGCIKISQLNKLKNGYCFLDSLGRRWWKIELPKQFIFEINPAVRGNKARARIMYCR